MCGDDVMTTEVPRFLLCRDICLFIFGRGEISFGVMTFDEVDSVWSSREIGKELSSAVPLGTELFSTPSFVERFLQLLLPSEFPPRLFE